MYLFVYYCIFLYIYVSFCIYMYLLVFICIYMYIYVFICIYMYLLVFICIFLCLYVFICIYMYIYVSLWSTYLLRQRLVWLSYPSIHQLNLCVPTFRSSVSHTHHLQVKKFVHVHVLRSFSLSHTRLHFIWEVLRVAFLICFFKALTLWQCILFTPQLCVRLLLFSVHIASLYMACSTSSRW